ncbi:MAG: hypothetical protein JJ864_07530 [Rhizobiaceae bacterium]|nr:hypothetical protein [Rhizobiaceae bacterium]
MTQVLSSVEIEQKIAAEDQGLAEALAKADELEKRRPEVAFDDGAYADLESEIAAGAQSAERHRVRIAALNEKLSLAVERERQSELRVNYEAAKAEIEAAAKWQAETYPQLALAIAEGFERSRRADRLALDINRSGVPAGEPRLQSVNEVVDIPGAPIMWPSAPYEKVAELPDPRPGHPAIWKR